MNQRHLILIFGLLVLLVAGLAFYVVLPSEPIYQGKRLSDWLKDWHGGLPIEEAQTRARESVREMGTNAPHWLVKISEGKGVTSEKEKLAINAVRAIGTNGIPTLLRMVQFRESDLKPMMVRLASKQSFVKFDLTPAHVRNLQALNGFQLLGSAAKPAIAQLIKLLHKKKFANEAAIALAQVGPEALPVLTNALTHTDWRVRAGAVNAFGAASPIGALASEASDLVPVLIRSLKDPDSHVRSGAARSLGMIGKKPEAVLPALAENLRWDPDWFVRVNAAEALGAFEGQAKPVVRALINALKDPDNEVRKSAGEALKKIGP